MKLLNLFLSFLLVFSGIPAGAWDQANSKVLQVDQASGVSSVPNYWKSGDAEVTLTGVSAYADAASAKPVDCTGGSPAITVARSETSPLYDKQSWLITKPASNVQGQGVAFEFDVDNGIAAVEMMDLMFEYIVGSGTFAAGSDTTNSDLMVYVYDVTAGQLIEPKGGSKLYTSSTTLKGDYRGWFQSTLGSKKYRVCLHQATTSASAYTLKVDAGKVQKSRQVVGTIITDWQSYTPTLTNAGNAVASNFRWMQVGPNILIEGRVTIGSSLPTGTILVSIPLGLNFASGVNNIGTASGYISQAYHGYANINGVDKIQIFGPSGSGLSWNASVPAAWTNGSSIDYKINAQIQGWSAGARMSDGYDGSPLYLKVQANNTTSPLTLTTTLQPIPFPTVSRDPLGCYNTTTGFCTVPRSSFYCAAGNASFAITGTMPGVGTEIARLELTIGNSGHIDQWFSNGASTTGGSQKLTVTACQYLNAGQTIALKARKDSSVSAATGTISQFADGNNLSIWDALQGYSIMSPLVTIAARATQSSAQSIPNATPTKITFNAETYDYTGWLNHTSGTFTATAPVICSVDASIEFSSGTVHTKTLMLYKNGSQYSRSTKVQFAATVASESVLLSDEVQLNAGETLELYLSQNTGAAVTLAASINANYFTVSCRQ